MPSPPRIPQTDRRAPAALVTRIMSAFGPAMGAFQLTEAMRAAGGGMVALLLVLVATRWIAPDSGLTLPLAASAVLVFALPNAPLAQPWSVVVGNTMSAAAGLAVGALVPDVLLALPLAFGMAVLAMAGLRALHPPGGAMAASAALLVIEHQAGAGWLLWPVAGESLLLVAVAVLWNRATGRVYPFRQAPAAAPVAQTARLRGLLQDFRQGANIGVADLARLIEAAESGVAAARFDGLTCAAIMSQPVVTVAQGDSLVALGRLFARYGYGAPPVTDSDRLTGLVTERDLIRHVMARGRRGTVADLGGTTPAILPDHAPVASLLPLLADGQVRAVPILHGDRLAGIVTRSDLLRLLTHELARTAQTAHLRPQVPTA